MRYTGIKKTRQAFDALWPDARRFRRLQARPCREAARLGAALLLVVVLCGCRASGGTALGQVPTDPEGRTTGALADTADFNEAGKAVYLAQYCGVCHTLDAAGTAGAFAPTHNAMAAIAKERIKIPELATLKSTAADYILQSIVDPTAYVVPGYETTRMPMPAYAHLSQEELDALVQFLMGQR